jgi:hypothetical protein
VGVTGDEVRLHGLRLFLVLLFEALLDALDAIVVRVLVFGGRVELLVGVFVFGEFVAQGFEGLASSVLVLGGERDLVPLLAFGQLIAFRRGAVELRAEVVVPLFVRVGVVLVRLGGAGRLVGAGNRRRVRPVGRGLLIAHAISLLVLVRDPWGGCVRWCEVCRGLDGVSGGMKSSGACARLHAVGLRRLVATGRTQSDHVAAPDRPSGAVVFLLLRLG